MAMYALAGKATDLEIEIGCTQLSGLNPDWLCRHSLAEEHQENRITLN